MKNLYRIVTLGLVVLSTSGCSALIKYLTIFGD